VRFLGRAPTADVTDAHGALPFGAHDWSPRAAVWGAAAGTEPASPSTASYAAPTVARSSLNSSVGSVHSTDAAASAGALPPHMASAQSASALGLLSEVFGVGAFFSAADIGLLDADTPA
jgi:hypothetical protein